MAMTTASALQTALKAHQAGRLEEAEKGYRQLLRREPRHTDALYLLAILLHQSGRTRDALEPLAELTNRANVKAEHVNTLGDVHRALGEFDMAVSQFERALALKPGYVEATLNLANTFNAAGRTSEALVLLFNSVAAQPTEAALRLQLAAMLNGVALHAGNELVREVLRLLCTDDAISAQSLAPAILGLVKGSSYFQSLLSGVSAGDMLLTVAHSAVMELMGDALLVTALPRLVVTDLDVEIVLTKLRGELLTTPISLRDETTQEFLAALAQQCFNTEYAWAYAADERKLVAERISALTADLEADSLDLYQLAPTLLAVALFEPLNAVQGWVRLRAQPLDEAPEFLQTLLREQIHEPAEEAALADAMPALTPVDDDTSRRVREMYEANPYPRWVTLQHPPVTDLIAMVRSIRQDNTRRLSTHGVLVAGCGSGQQPIQLALTLPDADVLGIDLSRQSLAYAARMANQFDVSNVRFAHADLLALDHSLGPFAIISCSGVLHHLSDPISGWRVLLSMLAPDGVMKVGLYSTLARTSVEVARRFVRGQNFDTSAHGIREARAAIAALPRTHSARAVVEFVDFYSLSGVRDLVMHVQERSYTIPEIADTLAELRLKFLGFQLPQPVQARFHAEFGRDAVLNLAAWEQFERQYPTTFAGMYQFWTAKL